MSIRFRIAAGLLLIVATVACGSPTEPSKPDFVGIWVGQYVVSGCTGGSDPRDCRNVFGFGIAPGPFTYSMRLRVTDQQGTSVSGTLTLEGPPHPLAARPFTGVADSAGVLSLEVSDDLEVCGVTPATARLINWRTQIAASGTMGGTFTYIVPWGPASCVGDVGRTFPFTTENQVQSLIRQSL
jgi:hypothetical protein